MENNKKNLTMFSRIARAWMIITLCAALVTFNCSLIMNKFGTYKKGDITILLDPGHGGSDVGATNNTDGLYEAEINLKIALACRNSLQKYDGVRVVMTHTGVDRSSAKAVLRNRVNVAEESGADIMISLHINSAKNRTANGAEIYVPHTTYKSEYNEKCTELAEMMLSNFQAIGLGSRGVKTRMSEGGRSYVHPDGTEEQGDYYYVVGEPIRRLQIPGILVEHAFIDGDSQFLDSDEELELLGIADADAIARFYGLELKDEYKDEPTFAQCVSDRTPNNGSVESDNDQYTPEEDSDNEITKLEKAIRELPSEPTKSDIAAVDEVRAAFDALGSSKQSLISAADYQKLCNAITVCENLRHPVRIALKSGSQFAIDRVNGKLLNVETAAQATGRVTVFAILLELEVYIDPSVANQYADDTLFDYRVTNPSDEILDHESVVQNNSAISIYYGNEELDTLIISIVGQ